MIRITRRGILAGGAAALLAGPASAVEARLIDPFWQRHGTADGPDHAAWDAILARYRYMGADGIARFDYRAADAAAVRGYLQALAAIDPTTLRPAAGFAYWANLYNALTIDVVLAHWPVRSIRRIGGSLFNPGPWREKRIAVAGRALSLDDIEHGILRPIWREPRVHYAVNCASLGCPDLPSRAFTAARLEGMLRTGAHAYVNHPRGARVAGGRLTASAIYDWFRADFGGDDAGVIRHLRAHADPGLAAALDGIGRVADHDYDWTINA